MAGSREIRTKISSVKNTQKITRAMEMVAASKMRKAQERMKKARPYGDKIRNVAAHMSRASSEYKHPFLVERDTVKRIGIIVVSSDKGLCGGLNTNILRLATAKIKEWEGEGEQIEVCCIGNKSLGFMTRIGANVASNVVGLGDAPHIDSLIGAVKVILDGYNEDRFDRVYLFYTRFINAMKQEPIMEKLLPLSDEQLQGSSADGQENDGKKHEGPVGTWDYIYKPDAKTVIDDVMVRYIEALIYQSLTENIASEQSARMVAMKAASDNAGDVINELTLVYNKTRQAAITKELSEIVAGAAAV